MLLNVFFIMLSFLSFSGLGQPIAKAQQEKRSVTPHIITLFIERTADIGLPPSPEHILGKVTRAGAPGRLYIDGQLRRKNVQGIYAVYMGWATHSDINGQILFPRSTPASSITLVVTRSLQPVLTHERLIHHFRASFDEPAEYYQFQLSTEQEEPSWNVYKQETPSDRVIPADAIVIIAKPNQMLIHEGTFSTVKSLNLILPTLYARPNLIAGVNALHFLKVNRYFAPVQYNWRYGTARYGVIITP